MNIAFYQSFIETAEQKSMAKASEKQNLTQPALSKQIRKLEDYYGTALFVRSPSGVELTEAGALLYSRIKGVLSELSAIHSDMRSQSAPKRYRIGTLPSLAAHMLPPKIFELEQNGVSCELVVRSTSDELLELLSQSAVDTVIAEYAGGSKTWWSKALFVEPLYAVFPIGYEWPDDAPISVTELDGKPLVMYPGTCTIRKCVTGLFEQHGLSPTIKSVVPFGDFILGYVAAGAGITVVPETIALHMDAAKLKAVPISDPQASRTVTLVSNGRAAGEWLYKRLI